MGVIQAWLGVENLGEVGYQVYAGETPAGDRITDDITETGDGWYEASGAPALEAGQHYRWDSLSDAGAKAREYYSSGSLTDTQAAQLLSAYNKTLVLGTGAAVQRTPVSEDGKTIYLTRGDDYLAADGRALEWDLDGAPDVTGATVTLTVGDLFTASGSVVNSTTVRVELPNAKTVLLPKRRATPPFELKVVLPGTHVMRPILGHVEIALGTTPV